MAAGQTQSGTVEGSILDGTGQVLPGVSVTLTGQGSSEVSVSSGTGTYRFFVVPPGIYTLRFELGGFQTRVYEEVRVDDRAFAPAELLPPSYPSGLRHFRLDWPAPAPGEHLLVSRARDVRGVQPTEDEASRYKATPWENNGQVVRRDPALGIRVRRGP